MAAQDRFVADGKKLVNEEKAKREEHPFDMYARMKKAARDDQYPKGIDVFRWKFHGLFYVAPAQDSFMCRLRIPNGILSAWQFRGIADLAERYGGGYADVTTRANLQIREIKAPTASPCWRVSRRWASRPAAPAPTTSATSPAAPPPASIRTS